MRNLSKIGKYSFFKSAQPTAIISTQEDDIYLTAFLATERVYGRPGTLRKHQNIRAERYVDNGHKANASFTLSAALSALFCRARREAGDY